jgi:hypothetical protein
MKQSVCAIFLLLSLFSLSFAENIPPVKGCDFAGAVLPKDFYVYAAGGYGGLGQYIIIDQSGHEATEFTVFINVTDKPVVLILSAYNPAVWQIKYTRNTNIAAVYLSGYEKQIITGLPGKTRLLNATSVSYCRSEHIISENRLDRLNPLSQQLFGKSVDMVYFAKQGLITIGDGINSDNYISSNARETVSFHDKTQPFAGETGIKDALDKKILRQATRGDIMPIYEYYRKDNPPVKGRDYADISVPRDAYVIEKDFIVPVGLSGAHSVTFILQKGVPFPKGDPGHSCLYDLNNFAAHGSSCSMRFNH